MAILDFLRARSRASTEQGDTDTVVRIVKELDKLEPNRARYLAAFAYVLSRVAGADRDISDVETVAMVGLVERVGRLPLPQATLVVEIAKSQNRHFAGTEDYLVTREFRDLASDEQRRDLLDCLFAVSKADATISSEEDAEMRQIAGELGFSHDEYIAVRLAQTEKAARPRL
jgi:uncharacterized tellurite resistance protein B-like protein